MRTLFTTLAVALFITAANAETLAEKRWRLRAEILERQLELVQMELREKEGASTEPASTKDFVNAYGTRFASLETDGTQVASLTQRRSSSVEDSPEASKTETKKTASKAKTPATKNETPASETEVPLEQVRDWPRQGERAFGYQILKPSSRIYFDSGNDDPGELDIFQDGNIGISVDFLTLSYDFGITDALSIGGFVAGGISSTTSEADHSAVLMWSAGIAVGVKDMPFSFEAGIVQGISASETLSDPSDFALFVGMSLTTPIVKRHIGPKASPTPKPVREVMIQRD